MIYTICMYMYTICIYIYKSAERYNKISYILKLLYSILKNLQEWKEEMFQVYEISYMNFV